MISIIIRGMLDPGKRVGTREASAVSEADYLHGLRKIIDCVDSHIAADHKSANLVVAMSVLFRQFKTPGEDVK